MKWTVKGFTLIEVLISVLLLATVAAGIFSAFVSANRWLKPETNVGYNLARQTAESLYTEVNQSTWSQGGGGGLDTGKTPTETISLDNNPPYNRTTEVSSVSTDSIGLTETYRKAEIVVSQ